MKMWIKFFLVVVTMLFGNQASANGTLDVRLTANPNPVIAGDRVFYEISVSNVTANDRVTVVEVSMKVPAQVQFNESDAQPSASCNTIGSNTVCEPTEVAFWDLGTLDAGESRTIRVNAAVFSGLADGTLIDTVIKVNYTGASSPISITRSVMIENSRSLQMSITESPDPVIPDSGLNYVVTFSNPGNNDVTGAELRAQIPAGTTFNWANLGGTEDLSTGEVVWAVGTIPLGSHMQRQFSVSVAGSAVDGALIETTTHMLHDGPLVIDNTATAVSRVQSSTPLSLAMTANPSPVVSGDRLFYEISLSNITANRQITDVVVAMTVSKQLQFNEIDTQPTASCNTVGSNTVCVPSEVAFWDLGTLDAGESRTIRVNAFVFSGLPNGTLINSLVNVSYTGANSPLSINRSVVVGNSPPLQMSITDSPDPVIPGSELNYIVAFSNPGNKDVTGAELRTQIPAGTTFNSANHGGTEDLATGEVVWTVGIIPLGSQMQRQFSVSVAGSAVDGALIETTARMLHDGPLEIDNTATSVSTVQSSIPLSLAITANPSPVVSGDRLFYEISLSNITANRQITDVVVAMTVAKQLQFNESDAQPFASCNTVGSNTVCEPSEVAYWELGTLDAGESRTIRVDSAVFSDLADGTLINTLVNVTYAGANSPLSINRSVVVEPPPALQMSITDSPDPVIPGSELNYIVAFSNPGNKDVTGAQLRAQIPAGTTFNSANHGGTENAATGEVVWTVGTIPIGARLQRQFSVSVAGSAVDGTLIESAARMFHDGPLEIDNTATAVSRVQSSIPLGLAITANPSPVVSGDRLFYEISLSNITANRQITDVVVAMTVPKQLQFNEIDAQPTASCNTIGSNTVCVPSEVAYWELGTLEAGESRTIRVNAAVFSGLADGTLINTRVNVGYTGASSPLSINRSVVVENSPPLQMSIVDSPDPVFPGSALNYKVVFSNPGNRDVTGAQLRAKIPAGTTFNSASHGGIKDPATAEVVWSVGRVAFGNQLQRQYSVSVAGSAVNGTLIESVARMLHDGGVETDNTSTAVTRVQSNIPLTAAITANPTFVVSGDQLLYEISLSNNTANSQITDVVVALTVPKQVLFNEVDAQPVASCDSLGSSATCQAAEVAYWNLGALEAGEARVIRINANVLTDLKNGTLISTLLNVTYSEASSPISLQNIVGLNNDSIGIDTDGDGVSDDDEINIHGTNPNLADTDGDGLSDGVELGVPGLDSDPSTTTNPLLSDSDGDGRLDGNNGFDPCEDCNNNGQVDAGETSPLVENIKPPCTGFDLNAGFNIISHPFPPSDLSCFGVLTAIGGNAATSMQRFNNGNGRYETCSYEDVGVDFPQLLIGDDFPIRIREGYLLNMKSAGKVLLPGCE